MSDIVEVRRRRYDEEPEYETYETDEHGRLLKYVTFDPDEDIERDKRFKRVKIIYPSSRSTKRQGVGISRYIVKCFLVRGDFMGHVTDQIEASEGRRVWMNAFETLAYKYNEMRDSIDKFVAAGGADFEVWGEPDPEHWRSYGDGPGEPWEIRIKQRKVEGNPYPYFAGFANAFKLSTESPKQPTTTLLAQSVATVSEILVKDFINRNEIGVHHTESLPDDLAIAVWKHAAHRLGLVMRTQRFRIGHIVEETAMLETPEEREMS
jgi:hypothetical protein